MRTPTAETMVPHPEDVVRALTVLGNGLVTHPRNHALRARLDAGQLDVAEYSSQLARLLYRMLFLLTAETHGVLPAPQASAAARQRYLRSYALARLQRLTAHRRSPKATGLYRTLWTVIEHLGSDSGDLTSGIPALGRFLHPAPALADLTNCALADQDIIATVQALGRATSAAQLNGEALVRLHLMLQQWQPVLPADASTFALVSTTGQPAQTLPSPAIAPALVSRLLETTLDPVLDKAVAQADPEAALLQIKICDPACGTGTFLRAAARRLATRLAVVRAGHATPTPEMTRQALCDVICHCLYGVDVHAPSVELCRLSLAFDALAAGTTWFCLDHHIQWGDSLLGATPAMLAQGIPDAAFTPVVGDDRAVAAALRKRNQHERLGQMALAFPTAQTLSPPMPPPARLLADAWCAAFLWPKTREVPPPVTHDTFCQLHTAPERVSAITRLTIEHLARQHHVLHWHIAFPEVFDLPPSGALPENAIAGWHGGFDVVLGKPPWQPLATRTETEHTVHLLRHTSRSRGASAMTLQPPGLFIEIARLLVRPTGRVGCLIPEHLITGDTEIVQTLMAQHLLISLYTVRNDARLMPRLPRTATLGLLTLAGPQCPCAVADVVWGMRQLDELDMPERHVPFSAADFALLNPNTCSWPVFRTSRAAQLTRAIYSRVPVLYKHGSPAEDAWGVQTTTMLHLTNDAALLRTRQHLEAEGWRLDGVVFRQGKARYVPVYEGTMLQPWGELYRADQAEILRYWVAPGHVLQAVSRVPAALLQAYGARKADEILLALAAWLAGYHLNHGHHTCTRETLAQTYNPMFYALPSTPGAWAAAPALARAWPLTPGDLLLIKRQHDVLTLARQLVEKHCPEWFMAWRGPLDPAQPVIATVLPRVGLAQTCPLLQLSAVDAPLASCLLANLNSMIVDFCARQKLMGRHLTPAILSQLPIVPPTAYALPCAWDRTTLLRDWVLPRVLELIYTAPELAPFARACGFDGPPYRCAAERRSWLRRELEAAYCLLYGLARAEVVYLQELCAPGQPPDAAVVDAAPDAQHVLQVYDALHQAMVTGTRYTSPLDPPPADPRLAQAHARPAPGGRAGSYVHQAEPRSADKYKTCVPLLEFHAVADAFVEGAESEPETWVQVPPGRMLRPGMFVAQMMGRAMEPQIPDGAYCLFERQGDGAAPYLQGRIVLVQHRDIYDSETGGNYTIRRYTQEQRSGAGRSRQPRVIRLLPLHPDYAPIVLDNIQVGERHVIAEFLTVLDTLVSQE